MLNTNSYAPYTSSTEIQAFSKLMTPIVGYRNFSKYMHAIGIIRHQVVSEATFGSTNVLFNILPSVHFIQALDLPQDNISSNTKQYKGLYSLYSDLSLPLLTDKDVVDENDKPLNRRPPGFILGKKALKIWVNEFLCKKNELGFSEDELFILAAASVFSLGGTRPYDLKLNENLDEESILQTRGFRTRQYVGKTREIDGVQTGTPEEKLDKGPYIMEITLQQLWEEMHNCQKHPESS